jgi:hypothetical protein
MIGDERPRHHQPLEDLYLRVSIHAKPQQDEHRQRMQ